ncbi:PD-(D/E)XK nuclease family transposase [Lachnospiraceae bacterium XBB1006]|nr:PD-(D/E)XK nuclease family transposase [Lachnospiraceae bacterium XBB1006]
MTKKNYFFASEKDVYDYLKEYPVKRRMLENMEEPWKQRLLDYMTGKKTLPFTYDPFFKMVFNPDRNPERLSSFLSEIMGRQVQVVDILPVEHTLHDGYSLIIMDLLVRLDDGSRANVEIQKYGAGFPIQRMSCYSADLLMQEYEWAKEHRKDGKFDYEDVNKVYTIVMYENSPEEFCEAAENGEYLHHGKVGFDTGLELDMLQEYFIVNLDIFKRTAYTKERSKLSGWLRFLTTEDMEDVEAVIQAYPWLYEIYEDVASYMRNPKEVLTMYSKTLQEMDEGAMRLYWDRVHEQLRETEKKCLEAEERYVETEKKCVETEKKCAETEKKCAAMEKERVATQQLIGEKEAEIERLKKQIQELEKHI